MKQTEFQFRTGDIEAQLSHFAEEGITELAVHDPVFASDHTRLLHFLQAVAKDAPELYVTLPVNAAVLDADICRAASDLFCSLDIPLSAVSKSTPSGVLCLFDKKFYAKKAVLLNDMGLVFGFDMDYALVSGDSLKLFRDRLDFALSQYPNHIDFKQIEKVEALPAAKPTGTFSSQDIRYARDLAFACKTFYTAGRAVPWFLSVLVPLKIQGSRFFADFAEWQLCDNCGYGSLFDPDSVPHTEIEEMQLLFLNLKYEEKQCESLFPVVRDIVRLNGAFARLAGEGTPCELEISYDPGDLLSPNALEIESFAENVVMEPCRVKVSKGANGPECRIVD
jgi:hypothetical protein